MLGLRWKHKSRFHPGGAFPIEPKAVVRGVLYSVGVVIALSLTVRGRGRRVEPVDSQILYYGRMVGGRECCTVEKGII